MIVNRKSELMAYLQRVESANSAYLSFRLKEKKKLRKGMQESGSEMQLMRMQNNNTATSADNAQKKTLEITKTKLGERINTLAKPTKS